MATQRITINPKLQGVFVNKVVMESAEGGDPATQEEWRVYEGNVASGQRPVFLYCQDGGRVQLGKGDVYWEKMLNPASETIIPWDDEQASYNFGQTHFQLKRVYNSLKKDGTWSDFVHSLDRFQFYRVAPPVSKKDLENIERGDLEQAIDYHVGGNFDLDPRIKAWGYGGLVRFPSHARYVPFTKYRGHSLIVKPPKAGCSHIAKRTSPTYDQISEKSFEGYADADGNISYSPLHENYHACVLDELDQLNDGCMKKLFSFLESGEYLSVKASRRIPNRGNCRVSFITNPKSMDENRGVVYAVNSVMDAYFDVLYKLTGGNFVAGMSRFGMVFVSSDMKQASGKSLPYLDQNYYNEIATSVFEVIAPKVARIFEDEQTQAWLSLPIDYYTDEITKTIEGFDDPRLKSAWGSQIVAYRHVRGASLEIAISENAFAILHDLVSNNDILDDATSILEDVVKWNLTSLHEIVNASSMEEGEDALVARLKRARPRYVAPILAGVVVSPHGEEVSVEAHYDALARPVREALERDEFYCWTHIARRIKAEGASKRLTHALSTFGVAVSTKPNGSYYFHLPQDKRAKMGDALALAYGLRKGWYTSTSSIDEHTLNSGGENTNPNYPTNPANDIKNTGVSSGVDKLPLLTLGLVDPNYPQTNPAISITSTGVVGLIGVVESAPPTTALTSTTDVKSEVDKRGVSIPTSKVVFKPKEAGGGYDLV